MSDECCQFTSLKIHWCYIWSITVRRVVGLPTNWYEPYKACPSPTKEPVMTQLDADVQFKAVHPQKWCITWTQTISLTQYMFQTFPSLLSPDQSPVATSQQDNTSKNDLNSHVISSGLVDSAFSCAKICFKFFQTFFLLTLTVECCTTL